MSHQLITLHFGLLFSVQLMNISASLSELLIVDSQFMYSKDMNIVAFLIGWWSA